MINTSTMIDLKSLLDSRIASLPGMLYLVVDKDHSIFEYSGGWADILNHKPMNLNTTLMAYSMTKTFTAVALLQLAEKGKLQLDNPINGYLPDCPYPRSITFRQLICHTSGIPNPIPLKWIHTMEEHKIFDEKKALNQVLHDHSKISFKPGTKYSYSNIGYWLLGQIIEELTRRKFSDYMKDEVFKPLGLQPHDIDFIIPDPVNHAKGYLAKYSFMNLLKGFVTDKKVWGSYEGKWLQIRSHYVNGPAFGGLVGSIQSFGRLLQDQLKESSSLLTQKTKELLYTQQTTIYGNPIEMTLGLHIGYLDGIKYFYKEGGGGGFHSEMRIYPTEQIASVIMVNSTEFNSRSFLSRLDEAFITQ
jgi:D-alanyl-D-alanine carboxypeptidase